MKPFWRYAAICDTCGNTLEVREDENFLTAFFIPSCKECGIEFSRDMWGSKGMSVIRVRYDGMKKDHWYQIFGKWNITIGKSSLGNLSSRAKKEFMSGYNVTFGKVEI